MAYRRLGLVAMLVATTACSSSESPAGGGAGGGNPTTTDWQGGGGAGGSVATGGQGGSQGGAGGVAPAVCGDGQATGDEVCDRDDFKGQTCSDFGRPQGVLACAADCGQLIDSLCYEANTTCGDGVTEGLERCDGTPADSCADLGFSGGVLGCTSGCVLDVSGCEGDYCELRGWYDDASCDPCELLGGTTDPDCAAHCGADGVCASNLSPFFGFDTCLVEVGAADPDCGSCGDGTLDPTEWCDGAEVPQSCHDLGYAEGVMACDGDCHLDPSGCTGVLSCAAHDLGTWDGTTLTETGDLCGGTAIYDNASACTGFPSPGHEMVYQLVVPADTALQVSYQETGEAEADLSLYVLSECGDPQSCIAGVDSYDNPEVLTLAAEPIERTVYIVADSFVAADCDTFSLTIGVATAEASCDDWIDNDGNGLMDCADPSCQGTPSCVPGHGGHGAACASNSDCASVTGNDPLCITAAYDEDFTNGLCAEFCQLQADDCGSHAVCAESGLEGDLGICYQTCIANSDCRVGEGYGCVDIGLSSSVCWPAG